MAPASPLIRLSQRPLTTFLLSAVLAAVVGSVVYLVTFAIPLLVETPATDPNFGPLNACLARELPEGRVGWALSVDGRAALAFRPDRAARCDVSADGGVQATPLSLAGVTAAAFDFDGNLWAATRPTPDSPSGLWRVLPDAGTGAAGELAPQALAGTSRGVVALEASGRLTALAPDGQVLALAELNGRPSDDAALLASADGERVLVVSGGALFVFEAQTLRLVRAESPCTVRGAWWSPSGHRALLDCQGTDGFALYLDVDTGEREAADARSRVQSTLVPRLGLWVQACEQLPCTAPAP